MAKVDGNLICLHEHERLLIDHSSFTDTDLLCLEKLNTLHGCDIIKIGRKEIKATQYVGFVRVKNKTLQVIPKIFKDDSTADLHFLFHILKYTKKLNVKDFSLSNLTAFKDDFFEILTWLFAKNLHALLERNMKKNYVLFEEHSTFIKGKLLVAEQIRKSHTDHSKHMCQFEEFTENNLLNQILKFTAQRLLIESSNPCSRKLLFSTLSCLVDVEPRQIAYADFARLHFTRLNYEYRPLVELAKILLLNLSITMQLSKLETFAFMFDMNRLFEEFIYEFMKKHQADLRLKAVYAQKVLGKLFNEFNMYYDILAKSEDGEDILIDTKYKVTDASNIHSGLSISDFYQIYTYASSQHKKYYRSVLLYPKFKAEEADYLHSVNEDEFTLCVRNINLEQIWNKEQNCLNEISLIKDLNNCLSKITCP